MSRHQKQKQVKIYLLKKDNKYSVVEPSEFFQGTKIIIPKNSFDEEIPETIPLLNNEILARKTRDSNRNVKQYVKLENIKIPVKYLTKTTYQPTKPLMQTIIFEPPAYQPSLQPTSLYQGQGLNKSFMDQEKISEQDIEESNEFNTKYAVQIQKKELLVQKQSEQQKKQYEVVTPSCASWFDMSLINQIEIDALPEYFASKPSKTPEVYMKYRNYIIMLYRQSPRTYLTATASRRNLAGDVCGILRVHAFLEHWGLINFNIDPKTQSPPMMFVKPFV